MLVDLLAPLAEAGISVFTISTFDTDWILVPGATPTGRPRNGDDAGTRSPPPPPPTPHRKTAMTVTHPAGFVAAGVAAGLKSTGAKDLALVVNQGPRFDSATVFTANRCKANPVLWSQEVVKDGVVQAVVLNSGGANCYTGADGFQTTHAVAEQVAGHLGIGADRRRRVLDRTDRPDQSAADLLDGVDVAYADARRRTEVPARREAIMTTDTVAKQVVVEGAGWSIGGMAKGAGMLAPQLATMLVVLTTDAVVPADDLDTALRAATRVSFDRLDSDGCMSTNDTVTVLASGASGITPTPTTSPPPSPRPAPTWPCSCSRTPRAPTTRSRSPCSTPPPRTTPSRSAGRVARSNLFKAAVFGNDPNWGRVLASIGTTDAAFDPADLDVAMNGVWVCRKSDPGRGPRGDRPDRARGHRHHRPQGRRPSAPRSGPTT